MNNMGNLAKGVQIGDGALAAYIEIGKAKRLSVGLFETTTDNRYRLANTIHNTPREASFYSIMRKMDETPMQSKRYFGGNLISAYNVDGIDIGWAYTTDINQHRLSRGVTTSADFDALQKLLRDRYFFNREDDYTPQLNAAVFKYGYLNASSGPSVSSFAGDLFKEIDFSLPVGKSENELLKNHLNGDITENGLLDYYKGKRNVLTKADFTNHIRYSSYIQYGSSQHEDTDIYKVGNVNNFTEYVVSGDFGKNTKGFDYEEGDISTTSTNSVKNNIISRTDDLFKRGKINSLVNRFHTPGNTKDQLSRGRNLRKANNKSTNDGGYDNPYCRVWTSRHQYSTMKDLIRPFGGENKDLGNLQKKLGTELRPNNASERLKNNSVLQDNGFVRITPQLDEYNSKSKEIIQNYMFSIENLAWKDSNKSLSPEQTGPNGGRIMWFPPYNLKFSENVNVNWNGNSFIGRGEQIYTYTNTERSGTLDFTLLIDHPSILDKWRGTRDVSGEEAERYKDTLLRFFAGCEMLDTTLNPQIKKDEQTTDTGDTDNRNLVPAGDNLKHIAYVIFFPNNYTGADNNDIDDTIIDLWKYEMTNDGTEIDLTDKAYSGQTVEKNQNLYSLNKNSGGSKERVNNMIKTALGLNSEDNITVYNLDNLTKITSGYSESDYKILWEDTKKYPIFMKYGNKYKVELTHVKDNRFKIGDSGVEVGFDSTIITENGKYFFNLEKDSDYWEIGENYFEYIVDGEIDEEYENSIFENIDKILVYDKQTRPITNLNKDIVFDELEHEDVVVFKDPNDTYSNIHFSEEIVEEWEEGSVYNLLTLTNDDGNRNWIKNNFKFEVPLEIIKKVEYLIDKQNEGDKIFGLDRNSYSIKKITTNGGYTLTSDSDEAKCRLAAINNIISRITLFNGVKDFQAKIYEYDDLKNSDIDINSLTSKIMRCGIIHIELEQNTKASVSNGGTTTIVTNSASSGTNKTKQTTETSTTTTENNETGSYDNEYTYFSKIQENDKMVTHIMKRVRHFDPAYHSLTPEGFNARLTFLQQCTRQGPTSSLNSGDVNKDSNSFLKWAGNLSFGRAPYCVLRIGDFFNTKICIESISINYDNGGGLQWDLNPEGAGVQPMFANVSITFKFLGGQDIAGPIEKLQNAVTSNYYANASVYDKNAEYKNNKK